MLFTRRCEGGQIASHQLAIVARRSLAAAIDRQRQIDVPADQRVLERLAQLHLQRVEARGQPQLHVEKAMIHALQAQRITQLVIDANLRARKPGHRINRHSFFLELLLKLLGSRGMKGTGFSPCVNSANPCGL